MNDRQNTASDSECMQYVQQFITPLSEAVLVIQERNKNQELIKKVDAYLNKDIPDHFLNGPILYLSRHIATPSFATLRFVELTKEFNLRKVIGEDKNDRFVAITSLKRSLAKLPIVTGSSRKNEEITEKFTIVDFDSAQGMQFKDVKTYFDSGLINFHNELFRTIYPSGVDIIDESDWVDRNHRSDLINHYKKAFALLIVNGIMIEFYETEDFEFVKKILEPAFKHIEETFGCRPLICNLVEPGTENKKDWHAYPSVLYKILKNNFRNMSQSI